MLPPRYALFEGTRAYKIVSSAHLEILRVQRFGTEEQFAYLSQLERCCDNKILTCARPYLGRHPSLYLFTLKKNTNLGPFWQISLLPKLYAVQKLRCQSYTLSTVVSKVWCLAMMYCHRAFTRDLVITGDCRFETQRKILDENEQNSQQKLDTWDHHSVLKRRSQRSLLVTSFCWHRYSKESFLIWRARKELLTSRLKTKEKPL